MRRQRIVLVALSFGVALTRLTALSRTVWDWDEVLFCEALHDFDVVGHHPHPPGFPLYVVLGRLTRLVIHDDFRALRAVNLVAAMFVFPAIYLLTRSFRFDFATAVCAALLFVFLPNVWFFGGTAFSDVPALVILLGAVTMLLRSRTAKGESHDASGSFSDRQRAWLVGCVLLGLALSFRPQNAIVAIYPILAASWSRRREWLSLISGAAIVSTIAAIAYGAVAYVTGFHAYREALRKHSDYLMKIDSYLSPARIPLRTLVPQFLFHPFGGGRVVIVMVILGAVALLFARIGALEVLLTFGPFFMVACFLLNFESSSRYSMIWLVGITLLAAEGIRVLAEAAGWVARRLSRRMLEGALSDVAAIAVALQFIATLPLLASEGRFGIRALREVRHASPTFLAMQWIREHVNRSETVYVVRNMQAFADTFLRDYTQAAVADDGSYQVADARGAWLVMENASNSPDAINFTRPRNELFGVARQRYFEVSVVPLSDAPRFGDGWYDNESDGVTTWRWMAQRSTTLLPPISGNGELSLRVYLPRDMRAHPAVIVSFNGAVVDRFVCMSAEVERKYVLHSRTGLSNELRLETDQVINLEREGRAHDSRDLGLQLRSIAWKGAP